MLTLIPSRLFQTQLVEDPAGSSKESTAFSLSFSMFHQNFTELKFRKILFQPLVLFFRKSKVNTWKTHKKRMLPKRNTLLLLTKKSISWRRPPPLNSDNAQKETLLFHWFDTFPYLAFLFITYVVNMRPVGVDVDIMITLILMCE